MLFCGNGGFDVTLLFKLGNGLYLLFSVGEETIVFDKKLIKDLKDISKQNYY